MWESRFSTKTQTMSWRPAMWVTIALGDITGGRTVRARRAGGERWYGRSTTQGGLQSQRPERVIPLANELVNRIGEIERMSTARVHTTIVMGRAVYTNFKEYRLA